MFSRNTNLRIVWRCVFLEFVICINIRFFFCVQLDPSFNILCVQKKNECLSGRNDALWIHLCFNLISCFFFHRILLCNLKKATGHLRECVCTPCTTPIDPPLNLVKHNKLTATVKKYIFLLYNYYRLNTPQPDGISNNLTIWFRWATNWWSKSCRFKVWAQLFIPWLN